MSNGAGSEFSKMSKLKPKDKLKQAQRKSMMIQRMTSARKVNKNPTNIEDILMNLCHSLAINEKTVFVAQLRKLMLAVDQEDEKLQA